MLHSEDTAHASHKTTSHAQDRNTARMNSPAPRGILRQPSTPTLYRRVGKVAGLTNVDAVVARARRQVLCRQHQPALALLSCLANAQGVIGEVGDEFVRRERGDAAHPRVGAMVPRQPQKVLCDRIRDLRAAWSMRM